MSTHMRISSFSDPSSEVTMPEAKKPEYWSLPRNHTSTSAPTISQLAKSRAHNLDINSQKEEKVYDGNHLQINKPEEKTDDSEPSSSNTSGDLVPQPQPSQPDVQYSTSMSQKQEVAFIFIACMSQFLSLSALNQTVAPVMVLAEHYQIEDYGTLSWFSASFSMSVGAFILPAGRLGDMYGHKRIYLIGWLWFAIWSLISGFSYKSGVILFSICRAFQGIGPALLIPNAVALIGRTLPIGQKRNIGFACFGASGPTGAATGAVFSALIADLAWWPWSFWILSIACVMTMGIAFIILPDESVVAPHLGALQTQRPKFDYWGTITGISGLVLINFALNQAPLVTWANPYIGILLGAGCLFMVAFVLVELYGTDYPLIPIRGLQADAVFALTCIAAGWGSHGIWAYYLYLFLEHLRGHSALLTSAETSPVAITGVFFAFSTVWLLKRIRVSYVMLISMTLFMVGSLLLATVPMHQTYWAQTFLSVLIMPGAMNLSYPAANILMSSALPKEKQGISASLVSTMVNYSISCGLGIAGTIDRYTIQNAASKRGWTSGNPAPLSDTSPQKQEIRLVGSRAAYWFAVGLSSIGMLVAFGHVLFSGRKKTETLKA